MSDGTTLLFVYGSLKRGFVNEHVNAGVRLDGRYRTRDRHRMYLLGEGEVPCIVAEPGDGHRVVGEVYRVTDEDIARMDRLERLGDPDGYERVTLPLERFDRDPCEALVAHAYVKRDSAIPAGTARIGPLEEYLTGHAANFRWQGA